jgi:hypothetical protein
MSKCTKTHYSNVKIKKFFQGLYPQTPVYRGGDEREWKDRGKGREEERREGTRGASGEKLDPTTFQNKVTPLHLSMKIFILIPWCAIIYIQVTNQGNTHAIMLQQGATENCSARPV